MSQPGLNISFSAIPGVTKAEVLPAALVLPTIVNEEFLHDKEGGHNEYDTIGAGSFSQPMGGKNAKKLRTVTFDAMAMTWSPVWMKDGGIDHTAVSDALETLLDSRSPFHFFAWLPATGDVEVDMYATLRRCEERLRHGETDTRYFNMDVSQYRQPRLQRSGKRAPKLPTKHRLTSTDTLGSLARTYYLSGSFWRRIRDANGMPKNWGSDDPIVQSKRFKVGDRIKIPAGPAILSEEVTEA